MVGHPLLEWEVVGSNPGCTPGGGGYSHFFFIQMYVGLDPATTVYHPKISGKSGIPKFPKNI